MSGKPAARITDPTACPQSGHGENPIVSGSPDVIFDGLNAARENDRSACGSRIVSGLSSTVFINGMRAATQGSVGEHGNTVTAGSSTVIIGDTHIPAPVTPVQPMRTNAVTSYSGRFQLIDQNTGKPVARRLVKVWSSDGKSFYDYTDAQGMTRWVRGNSPQTLHLDLEQEDGSE